ncbi:putative ribonuclease H protein [Senna tora]|uniref:Putative ribonuclease H protein n=1 Tax=Senna tora TaxID=362788 RepID=A0A834W3X7_9FABA|nr:putative ribonuclease H protein [Senna tora]
MPQSSALRTLADPKLAMNPNLQLPVRSLIVPPQLASFANLHWAPSVPRDPFFCWQLVQVGLALLHEAIRLLVGTSEPKSTFGGLISKIFCFMSSRRELDSSVNFHCPESSTISMSVLPMLDKSSLFTTELRIGQMLVMSFQRCESVVLLIISFLIENANGGETGAEGDRNAVPSALSPSISSIVLAIIDLPGFFAPSPSAS